MKLRIRNYSRKTLSVLTAHYCVCFDSSDYFDLLYSEIFPPAASTAPASASVPTSTSAAPGVDSNAAAVHETGSKTTAKPTESALPATYPGTASQDLDDKEWESVEKPSLASSTMDAASETDAVHVDSSEAEGKGLASSAELAEEGVKVEAANLAEEEGVEVEKPKEFEIGKSKAAENILGKDW